MRTGTLARLVNASGRCEKATGTVHMQRQKTVERSSFRTRETVRLFWSAISTMSGTATTTANHRQLSLKFDQSPYSALSMLRTVQRGQIWLCCIRLLLVTLTFQWPPFRYS